MATTIKSHRQDSTNFSGEKSKFTAFDNLNINNLNSYYNPSENSFKKKIDKLNQKFYLETDKFIFNKAEYEKAKDSLFIVLFKEIGLYIEEIEKLNVKIKEKEDLEKFNKFKVEENKKDTSEKMSEKDVTYYKSTIRILEKKLSDKTIFEDNLKRENESYKRQLNFYKDKLKIGLNTSVNMSISANINHSKTPSSPINILPRDEDLLNISLLPKTNVISHPKIHMKKL